MSSTPLISLLIITPLAGALVLSLMPPSRAKLLRRLGLGWTMLPWLPAVAILLVFDRSDGTLQLIEKAPWIPALGADYFVGVDGISLILILLTCLITPFALASSFGVRSYTKAYCVLILILQAMLFGTFTALNFVLWFLFWELALAPAFLLIRIWGGPGRTAAAYQFFLYTLFGSLLMLLSFIAIYLATGQFDFVALAKLGQSGGLEKALGEHFRWLSLAPSTLHYLVFFGVLVGVAVKVPILPLHAWLPAAYSQAPVGGSILLTGIMSKMGLYGFLRVLMPIFPGPMQTLQGPMIILAVATIVFAAAAALAQTDLKRIIAYSSINHLGYCLLGIFAVCSVADSPSLESGAEKAAALNGVVLQLANHGIIASALFGFIGFLELRSGGSRGLNDFGGIRRPAPVLCGLMGITLFASIGLPGLNGFVGELLIFKGALPLAGAVAAVACVGLLLTAIFLIRILQRVFNGPLNPIWEGLSDLSMRERLIMGPMIGLMLLLGIYPQLVIGLMNPTIIEMLDVLP